jgi:MFS family permease
MVTADSAAIVVPVSVLRDVPESLPRRRRNRDVGRVRAALSGRRDFTLLWAGQAVSQLGTRIYGVAFMLWVLVVTGSVVQTGVIASVSLGAFAVAQLPGGWLADRFDRRWIMVLCDASSALAALSLCVAAFYGWFNIAHVLVSAVVFGVGWAVRGTAEGVSLADVLPSDEVAGAAAMMSARGHAAGLAGPPAAINLFSVSAALPFLVDGVSYLVAMVCAAFVRTPLRAPDRAGSGGSVPAEIANGARHFWRVRFVRLAGALDAVAAFASNSLALLVIVLLRDVHASAPSIGIVLAMGSVGGLTGAVIATSLSARLASPLPVLTAAPAAAGLALVSLAFAGGTVGIAVGFGAFFLLWPAWSAVLAAQFLRRVDAEHRGRVMGTSGLLGAGAIAAAPVSTGLLLAQFGTRTTCLVLAGMLAVVALTAGVAPALRDEPLAGPSPAAGDQSSRSDEVESSPAADAEATPHEEPRLDPPAGPKLPLLLRGPLHHAEQSPRSMDFQARVGRPSDGDRRGPQPCVLVMTRTADREIDDLSLRLAAASIPLVRMDSDQVAEQGLLWDPGVCTLTTREGSFRPVVSWLRYFTTASMPARAGDRPELASYQRAQWSGWAPIMLSARGVSVVNRVAGAGSPDRVTQLAEARAAGLRIPATVVTNSAWAAAHQLPGHGDVIVKALGEHYIEPRPGSLIGIAPRRLTRHELMQAELVEPAPMMVQEFLPSEREFRVYLVGGELMTYDVTKPSPESLWEGDLSVYVRAMPTPPELETPLLDLAEKWDLDVAAFDLLDTADGPVFLEVNPACDWLWSEKRAGDNRVSERVAAVVSARFEDARSTLARADRCATVAGAP